MFACFQFICHLLCTFRFAPKLAAKRTPHSLALVPAECSQCLWLSHSNHRVLAERCGNQSGSGPEVGTALLIKSADPTMSFGVTPPVSSLCTSPWCRAFNARQYGRSAWHDGHALQHTTHPHDYDKDGPNAAEILIRRWSAAASIEGPAIIHCVNLSYHI